LHAIGGQTIAIRTEDGVVIEAMFFDVNAFHDRIVALGGRFKIGRDRNQMLISTSYRLSRLLRELKIDNNASYGFRVISSRPDGAMIISVRPNALFISSIRTKHVAILTQGNGGIFIFGKAEITETLMKGMCCMAFDIRGTGRSCGAPTEIGTYYDIEAVYRYARMRGFSDHQISVHGYCLGAALACELASRHPVNLILRTPFAGISDVIADIATSRVIECFKLDPDSRKTIVVKRMFDFIISKLVSYVYISYDNASKIRKIKTPILLIESSIDEVLPLFSRERCRAAVASTPRAAIQVTDQMGHNDEYDSETLRFLNSFLIRHDLMRNFPVTSPGLFSKAIDIASEVAGICSDASVRSVESSKTECLDASVQSVAISEASVHCSLPSNGSQIRETADI